MLQRDAAVGFEDNLAQQVALREGLQTVGQRRGSEADVKPGVLAEPVLVQLLVSKGVVERQVLAQLRILYVGGHFEEAVGKPRGVHALADVGGVVDKPLQQRQRAVVPVAEFLERDGRQHLGLLRPQLGVVLVHVVHVVLAGIVGNGQARIQDEQLLQGVFHRQDTANDDGALGIDGRLIGEHLGEALVHAARYLLLLLSP